MQELALPATRDTSGPWVLRIHGRQRRPAAVRRTLRPPGEPTRRPQRSHPRPPAVSQTGDSVTSSRPEHVHEQATPAPVVVGSAGSFARRRRRVGHRQHPARPHPISQATAAWPPLALLLNVELIFRVPIHTKALTFVRLLATAVIAGIAAWVFYRHMAAVATRYGETSASP